jgi:type I restriction enzyme S subunit
MRNTKTQPVLRFPNFKEEWKPVKLNEILKEHKTRNTKSEYDEVFSVAKEKGVINQIEHLGRSYASDDITNYKVVFPNDVVYTKSPTAGFPFGIIKQNKMDRTGVVSVLYAVFKPKNFELGLFLDFYFSSWVNTYNYLVPLVHKGAKNTMNIGNEDFLNGAKISLPPQKEEQKKITDFLIRIDNRITQLTEKKENLEQYKKGITQKIFSQKLRFKDDNGNEFPKWKLLKIGQLFTERSEKGYSELELLSVSMNTGVQKKSDTSKTDNSSNDKSNYKKVDLNDIVYNSMRMWQGASGVSNYIGIVSPAYTVITPKPLVNSIYFGFLFKTKKMINIFERNSQGLTSDTWNLKFPQLSKIELIVPDIDEQNKIASFLTSIDEKIFRTENQIQETHKYKKGLLQNMFI